MTETMTGTTTEKITQEQLNTMTTSDKDALILKMQIDLANVRESLSFTKSMYDNLYEQVMAMRANRFGHKSEKLSVFDGQLSLFNEAEALSDDSKAEPPIEEALPKRTRKAKKKGQREEDLKGYPTETHDHTRSKEELNAFYGEGNWRELKEETYKTLRYEPSKWTVEEHVVHVYVGKDGEHQDEFMRGECPKRLLRTSFLTPSLLAGVLNGKYTNAMPLNRIEQEFQRNDISISRQTMANWMIRCYEKYLGPVEKLFKETLFEYPVGQCDETPVTVVGDKNEKGSTSGYMWVHRSGEFCRGRPVIIYEYNKSRAHDIPKVFYEGFKGVLVTDGLDQYHILDRVMPGITNANCWAHARRFFSDAIKAMGKSNPEAVKTTTAYQALLRIALIYDYEGSFKDLSGPERLTERKKAIAPLVDEFFKWAKERIADVTNLPKGLTARGLSYCINQEKYLRVFLENGDVPIDDSASERAIRPFTVGRKNWMIIASVKGAKASACYYSIVETAKLYKLNIYNYFVHLFTKLPELSDENGKIEKSELDQLMPWSKKLPANCYKAERR